MRAWGSARTAAAAVLSASLGASLVACFDLFHSTSGILSACALDAQACEDGGTQVDADVEAGTDFCGFTPDEALAHAQQACAWLGACETPLGGNAPGACMFDALLAYDCTTNPSHPARGLEHALWDCLWQVQSCSDVARCVFPGGAPTRCGGTDFVACGSDHGGVSANADVRIECVDGGMVVGENCALTGQTCASDGGYNGICAGAAGAAGLSCPASPECIGAHLHECGSDGGDVGIDCASNGAGQCQGFPSDVDASWIACVASGDAGCEPSDQATCVNGYAVSCPSGVPEQLYCPELLQLQDAGGNSGCVPGTLSPQFDWTSPCIVQGGCTADSCATGGVVLGCTRGTQYALDCSALGLGACEMVATDVGTAMHAACTPP
jgi:hypothetical protein